MLNNKRRSVNHEIIGDKNGRYEKIVINESDGDGEKIATVPGLPASPPVPPFRPFRPCLPVTSSHLQRCA